MPYFAYPFSNSGNGKKTGNKANSTIPEAQEIKETPNTEAVEEAVQNVIEEPPLDIKAPLDNIMPSYAEMPLPPNMPVNPQMYSNPQMFTNPQMPVNMQMCTSPQMPINPLMHSMPQMPMVHNPNMHTCPYLMYTQMIPEVYNTLPFDTAPTGVQSDIIRPAGDPPPVLSNNPPSINIVMFKELTGYPNYGNPSRNADILYTGNRGTWTFELPGIQQLLLNQSAQVIIRAVLDDHNNVPINRYSARISINERVVHNGPVPLDHGTPAGSMFTNWKPLTFTINNIRRMNRITIENTSRTGPEDWMAFDWIEIRLIQR
ncbi:MAG TPA: hypothetical protein VIO64_03210 [Pseudobacteroides sp.]|uniref:hypothetical protein n=1 Tax=Pseudobacteroides sp. TaxID=1968840 RepID=UPI002F93619E